MANRLLLTVGAATTVSVLLTACGTTQDQVSTAASPDVNPKGTASARDLVLGLSETDQCADVVSRLQSIGFTSIGTLKPIGEPADTVNKDMGELCIRKTDMHEEQIWMDCSSDSGRLVSVTYIKYDAETRNLVEKKRIEIRKAK